MEENRGLLQLRFVIIESMESTFDLVPIAYGGSSVQDSAWGDHATPRLVSFFASWLSTSITKSNQMITIIVTDKKLCASSFDLNCKLSTAIDGIARFGFAKQQRCVFGAQDRVN